MTDATVGISGIALSVPGHRVPLESWSNWYGHDWGKVRAVVGTGFRVADNQENAYTLAANACLKLIEQYEIDPRRIGLLALGTESSTDNSAGAVIVRGMLDLALRERHRAPLNREVEVPEFKHACLGGIYALKAALRYVATDAGDDVAIVVASDIAEYERGSSGEQTQGAGAVALLVERDPSLLAIDLPFGSASSFRGADFRKPLRRYADKSSWAASGKMHDFPIFNGKYSTSCYIDETLQATRSLARRRRVPMAELLDQAGAILMHRPYHHMPVAAMSAIGLAALAHDAERSQLFASLCADAGVDATDVRRELGSETDLYRMFLDGGHDRDPFPTASKVIKVYRGHTSFKDRIQAKMKIGSELAKELGNLYSASLPAWIAAAFEDALERDDDLTGASWLAIGYGSGNASEAFSARVVEGWRASARKIGFRAALSGARDISQIEYEALHAGEGDPREFHRPHGGFVIDRVGATDTPAFQDLGVEYYRYQPGDRR
ncbi:MAG: hypothetical protein KC609_21685 [Myxococcales bacterium]|nr:hypothetical protein [Myxococcales bacterium]